MRSRGINLDRWSAFVAVAQTGSFTAAAQRLGMTKSALSQAVARLEHELGVQLLQRSTRRLAITEAGGAFLRECEAFLAQAQQLVERARTAKASPAGTLKLTSGPDLAARAAQWIARYCSLHPQVRVDYHPTDQIVDLIEGGFDLGLRVGFLRDSRLHAVMLGKLDLFLVAADSYLRRRGTPKTPADLASHEWIAYSRVPAPWTLRMRSRTGKTVTVRMQGAVSVSAGVGQRALALAGVGVTAMPQWSVQADIEAGRLRRLLPNYRLPELSFFAVYPGTVPPPAKTRAFIDLVKEPSAGDAWR
ncbi:MAG TPA: LysR family transcriptional regulator [Burkholderiales bacterium]|nr:LysR family transcriptional regulator [Burkholderiales bacterium]